MSVHGARGPIDFALAFADCQRKACDISCQIAIAAAQENKVVTLPKNYGAEIQTPRPKGGPRETVLTPHGVFGTPPERDYDQLAELTAELLDAPTCLISFVGERDLWLKARVGLDVGSIPTDISFCAHTVQSPDPLIVLDARLDVRFADNPLVKGGPCLRFYAGAPVMAKDGTRLGALCVIDKEARADFGIHEMRCLSGMADIARKDRAGQ